MNEASEKIEPATPENLAPSKDGARIRGMFAGIARRYDLLNHVLSLNIDRSWRRRAAKALEIRPEDLVLDACTGTADLALELARHVNGALGGHVVGTDFTPEMVEIGERKRRRRREPRVTLLVADTLALPFANGVFDAASVAFGIRNVADLDRGLRELARVLRPGGRLAILEFTTPRRRWLRRVYRSYFHRVLPRIGRWLSRTRSQGGGEDAYSYLPASVDAFPRPVELEERIREAGFHSVRHQLLSAGIAALHVASRSGGESSPSPDGDSSALPSEASAR